MKSHEMEASEYDLKKKAAAFEKYMEEQK